MNRKTTIPLFLTIVWLLVVAWQGLDHFRFKDHARTALLNRARDITNSLAIVIRSQKRFGSVIPKDRLESALQDLTRMEDLRSIALLNALGEVVTSTGEPMNVDINDLPKTGEQWEKETVTFVNLVDLGADPDEPDQEEHRTLILQFPEPDRESRDGPPPPPPDWAGPNPFSATGPIQSASDQIGNATARERRGDWNRDRRRGPPRFGRPFWMSEQQFQTLLQKQGLHGFVLVLSTHGFNSSLGKDLWMRTVIAGFALLAMAAVGLAWRNLIKTSELQLRLVRASEMNAHLREMNVAAAGLAHETRNPLNVVRGLAQLIAKQEAAPGEIRDRARKITDEVDRVTVQLNEFIDYSKPREPKPAPVAVNAVAADVERALRSDMEDKAIQFHLSGPDVVIDADESLLRQILFNLLLNSIQSVPPGGRIEIAIDRPNAFEAQLEIRDNGPGVSLDIQDKIFQPYFTTHEKGTGLGLAVVRQIVMLHGWTIQYRTPPEGGAAFCIAGMKINTKTT